MSGDWEGRVAAAWDRFAAGALPDDELVRAIDALAAELPGDDPRAPFERASARDSAGIEDEAEPLYRAALAGGLDPYRRARATIQLASTLRILGELDESERLLRDELACGEGPLRDEVRAFLALTLVAAGRPAEGAGHALTALAPHLTRYHRSVTGNAAELTDME